MGIHTDGGVDYLLSRQIKRLCWLNTVSTLCSLPRFVRHVLFYSHIRRKTFSSGCFNAFHRFRPLSNAHSSTIEFDWLHLSRISSSTLRFVCDPRVQYRRTKRKKLKKKSFCFQCGMWTCITAYNLRFTKRFERIVKLRASDSTYGLQSSLIWARLLRDGWDQRTTSLLKIRI